jgi:hypothetical protein
MVTVLPFIVDPVLYRNAPHHILPLQHRPTGIYLAVFNRHFLPQRKVIASAITN